MAKLHLHLYNDRAHGISSSGKFCVYSHNNKKKEISVQFHWYLYIYSLIYLEKPTLLTIFKVYNEKWVLILFISLIHISRCLITWAKSR